MHESIYLSIYALIYSLFICRSIDWNLGLTSFHRRSHFVGGPVVVAAVVSTAVIVDDVGVLEEVVRRGGVLRIVLEVTISVSVGWLADVL